MRCFGWPVRTGTVLLVADGSSAPGYPAGHGTTTWAVWAVGSLPAANDTV